MRPTHAFVLAVAIGLTPLASADLLWDNYAIPDGLDRVSGFSSERATLISDSWVVHDAVFETPVIVEQIQWIGLQGEEGTGFTGADYIIMDSEFNVVVEVSNVAFDANLSGDQFFGWDVYEGTVQVEPVALDAGQYYFGARLVNSHLGRNFAATSFSGADLIRGDTEAYIRSVPFGIDDWTPASQVVSSGIVSDFAYRIDGTVIPEPTSLILLLIGAAATLRRRS